MMTKNNIYIFRNDVLWIMKVLGVNLFNSLTAKIASWKLLEQKITHFMRLRDLSVQLSFFVFHITICIFVCIVQSTLFIKNKKIFASKSFMNLEEVKCARILINLLISIAMLKKSSFSTKKFHTEGK